MRKKLTQGEKLHKSLIARFGSEKAVREWRRSIGAKGGKKSIGGGFSNPDVARRAGKRSAELRRQKWLREYEDEL